MNQCREGRKGREEVKGKGWEGVGRCEVETKGREEGQE